jgi:hypothetical protein
MRAPSVADPQSVPPERDPGPVTVDQTTLPLTGLSAQ